MFLKRTGSCNHCGKCCLCIELGGVMLENACIDLGEDRCKFYVEQLQGGNYGHCLIYAGGLSNIKKAKTREGKRITEEQIRWFNENCLTYPEAKDAESGTYPPKGCSFTFEVKNG